MPVSTPFYLLLISLAAGIAAALVLAPPRQTGAGYARTMALVGLGCLAAALAYDLWFRLGGGGRGLLDAPAGHLAASGPALAALLLGLFVARLGGQEPPGRALPVAAALAAGVAAAAMPVLILASPPEPEGSRMMWSVAAAQGAAGAAVLGGGMSAMLLGHFYLVVPGLAIAPLRLLTRLFVLALGLKLLLGLVALSSAGWERAWPALPAAGTAGGDPLEGMLTGMVPLIMRVLFGLAGALVLGVMGERTVAMRSTQSATGILYGAVVFVLLGEFAAGHLLVARGLPL